MKEVRIQYPMSNKPNAFTAKLRLQRKNLRDLSPAAKQELLKQMDDALNLVTTWKNEVITHF